MSDLKDDDDDATDLLGKIYRDILLIVVAIFIITAIHFEHRGFKDEVIAARSAFNYLGLRLPLDENGLQKGLVTEPAKVLEGLLTISPDPHDKYKIPLERELQALSEKGLFFGAEFTNFYSFDDCFVLFVSTGKREEVSYFKKGGFIKDKDGELYSLVLDEKCAYIVPDVVIPTSAIIMDNGDIPYLYYHKKWLPKMAATGTDACLFHNSCREITSAIAFDSKLNELTMLKVNIHHAGEEFRRSDSHLKLVADLYAGRKKTSDTFEDSSLAAIENLRARMPSNKVEYMKQSLGRKSATVIAVVLNFVLQVSLLCKILALADKSYSSANTSSILLPSRRWNVPHSVCRLLLLLTPFGVTVWLGLIYQDNFRFVFSVFDGLYINPLDKLYVTGDDVLMSYRFNSVSDVPVFLMYVGGVFYWLSVFSAVVLTPMFIYYTSPEKGRVRTCIRAVGMALNVIRWLARFKRRRKARKMTIESAVKKNADG